MRRASPQTTSFPSCSSWINAWSTRQHRRQRRQLLPPRRTLNAQRSGERVTARRSERVITVASEAT
eukprot:365704-Chlamydomonas_euryale.AAC.1